MDQIQILKRGVDNIGRRWNTSKKMNYWKLYVQGKAFAIELFVSSRKFTLRVNGNQLK